MRLERPLPNIIAKLLAIKIKRKNRLTPGLGEAVLKIIIALSKDRQYPVFINKLKDDPRAQLQPVASGESALELAKQETPDLLVVQDPLNGRSAFDFLRDLILVNPMINSTVISPLSEKAFGDAGEGLGILMQLTDPPGANDARRLLDRLEKLMG